MILYKTSFVKTRTESRRKKLSKGESIAAFKEELRSLTFEPIYGDTIKSIITSITTKIQTLAEEYGYEIEFPKRAEIETDGNIYYFIYTLKVKTKITTKRIRLHVQYIMYEEENWIGIITEVK